MEHTTGQAIQTLDVHGQVGFQHLVQLGHREAFLGQQRPQRGPSARSNPPSSGKATAYTVRSQLRSRLQTTGVMPAKGDRKKTRGLKAPTQEFGRRRSRKEICSKFCVLCGMRARGHQEARSQVGSMKSCGTLRTRAPSSLPDGRICCR